MNRHVAGTGGAVLLAVDALRPDGMDADHTALVYSASAGGFVASASPFASALIPVEATVTGNTAVAHGKRYFPVDATSADVTMTLDPASTWRIGSLVAFKKVAGSHNVEVKTTSPDKFEDGATSRLITALYSELTLVLVPATAPNCWLVYSST